MRLGCWRVHAADAAGVFESLVRAAGKAGADAEVTA